LYTLPVITSLPLEKQLVLELERGKTSTEVINGLPSGVSFRKRLPLYQNVPDATTELGAQRTARMM
jgi:hypothetical protein